MQTGALALLSIFHTYYIGNMAVLLFILIQMVGIELASTKLENYKILEGI
jgi:hypothetical protein